MNPDVTHHQRLFEDLYGSGKFDTETVAALAFPLRDIDRYHWGRGSYSGAYFSYHYRRFTCHILSALRIRERDRVLNIGCGFGFEEKNIENLWPQVDAYACDISGAMIRLARCSGVKARLSVCAAEALPFPDQAFDRIVSREVIEHVMLPEVMLREVKRVLKPDGIAVVTTENPTFLSPHRVFPAPGSHLHRRARGTKQQSFVDDPPSPRAMRRLARAAGLDVEKTLFDGALYSFLSHPHQQEAYEEGLEAVARQFVGLEGCGVRAHVFCDQVKYVLRRPAGDCTVGQLADGSSVPFVCPTDQSELASGTDSLRCLQCGTVFPIVEGVPDFTAGASTSATYQAEEALCLESDRPAPRGEHESVSQQHRGPWLREKLFRLYERVYFRLARAALRLPGGPADGVELPADSRLRCYLAQ